MLEDIPVNFHDNIVEPSFEYVFHLLVENIIESDNESSESEPYSYDDVGSIAGSFSEDQDLEEQELYDQESDDQELEDLYNSFNPNLDSSADEFQYFLEYSSEENSPDIESESKSQFCPSPSYWELIESLETVSPDYNVPVSPEFPFETLSNQLPRSNSVSPVNSPYSPTPSNEEANTFNASVSSETNVDDISASNSSRNSPKNAHGASMLHSLKSCSYCLPGDSKSGLSSVDDNGIECKSKRHICPSPPYWEEIESLETVSPDYDEPVSLEFSFETLSNQSSRCNSFSPINSPYSPTPSIEEANTFNVSVSETNVDDILASNSSRNRPENAHGVSMRDSLKSCSYLSGDAKSGLSVDDKEQLIEYPAFDSTENVANNEVIFPFDKSVVNLKRKVCSSSDNTTSKIPRVVPEASVTSDCNQESLENCNAVQSSCTCEKNAVCCREEKRDFKSSTISGDCVIVTLDDVTEITETTVHERAKSR